MTIDWSDPAWVAIVVAIAAAVLSIISAAISWRGLKWQKKAALAADRSANEAEKATAILALEAEHRTTQTTTAAAADVQWTLERSKDRFTLRNTGTDIATGVNVGGRGVAEVGTQIPQGAAVRPRASVSFMMAGSMAHSVPDEIEVTWDGHPEPVVVPVPPRR